MYRYRPRKADGVTVVYVVKCQVEPHGVDWMALDYVDLMCGVIKIGTSHSLGTRADSLTHSQTPVGIKNVLWEGAQFISFESKPPALALERELRSRLRLVTEPWRASGLGDYFRYNIAACDLLDEYDWRRRSQSIAA